MTIMQSLTAAIHKTSLIRLYCGICRNLSQDVKLQKHGNFGICIDIDGVMLRGKAPIPGAIEAMRKVTDKSGRFKHPVVFLTNSSIPEDEKAEEISKIFNIQALPEQFVMASSPLSLYKSFHDQKCLFLGQDDLHQLAKNLGFSNGCTIKEVAETFPLLDTTSHQNRPYITEMSFKPPSVAALSWKPIEAIILFTTPLQWETALQLTSDILLTQGDPRRQIRANAPLPQLPVIACNPDMQFMHVSHLPRFGHGSFILCLEEIYKKLTGRSLEYSAVLGKPSEASFRFAEHRLYKMSQSLGLDNNITTMYMIGDNQEVDVVGGNMYHQYVTDLQNNTAKTPQCRTLPQSTDLGPQNVRQVKSYLVKTGVYQESVTDTNRANCSNEINKANDIVHSHRNFNITKDLLTPYKVCYDVNDAIEDIFSHENV